MARPYFLGGWLPAVFLEQPSVLTHQLVDGLNHVDRYANGTGLVRGGRE